MVRYYLAFASNMSRAQMAMRCPAAKPIAAVRLTGWKLAFRGTWSNTWGQGGVASLDRDAGGVAPAALYELSEADELEMDRWEGVNREEPERGAYRKLSNVAQDVQPVGDWRLPAGAVVFAYLCNHVTATPPSAKYLATISQGYRDWGFSEEPAVESNFSLIAG